ncbi:Protein-export membrane protein SecF [Candidatus Anstonella stagnisolia]|nr:Protein-export membrane protein SecF [Candidatus Anstonella stagnisolia]
MGDELTVRFMVSIPNPYTGNYRMLAIAPIIIILVALFFIPQIRLGVEFKGGTLITIASSQENIDEAAANSALRNAGIEVSSLKVYKSPTAAYKSMVEIEIARSPQQLKIDQLKGDFFANVDEVSKLEALYQGNLSGAENYLQERAQLEKTADEAFAIAATGQKASDLKNINVLRREVSSALAKANDGQKAAILSAIGTAMKYDAISIEEISASLSSKFIEKAVGVVFVSTFLVIIAVFIIYRTLVPSIAVLAGAAADILIALGAMGLFGIPFTLASFAALLMLVGFSLDTDILLTMRVIKRKEGHASERAYDAMKTGMTMSLAAMVAFGSLFVLSYITHIGTYYEISTVAICGLVGDVFATWGINAVIILNYAEKREKEGHSGEEKPIFTGIFSH